MDRGQDAVEIIFEETDCHVAAVTQEAADRSSPMIVIDIEML